MGGVGDRLAVAGVGSVDGGAMLTQGSFFGEALSAKKAGRLWVVSGERAGGPSAAIKFVSPHDHHSEQSFRPFV